MLLGFLINTWDKYSSKVIWSFIFATGFSVYTPYAPSSEEKITQDGPREQSFMNALILTFVLCFQITLSCDSLCKSLRYLRDVFWPALNRYLKYLEALDQEIRSRNESGDTIVPVAREQLQQESAQMGNARRIRMEAQHTVTEEAVAALVARYQQVNGSLNALEEQVKTKDAESTSDANLYAYANTHSDSDGNTEFSSACSFAWEPNGLVGCIPKPKSKSKSKCRSKSKRRANRWGSNQQSEGQDCKLHKTKDVVVDASNGDSKAWAQARGAVGEKIERRRIQLDDRVYTNTSIPFFC